jgi:excinuclease UvrABC ATPase subunit
MRAALRRVVTGVDGTGRSSVIEDGLAARWEDLAKRLAKRCLRGVESAHLQHERSFRWGIARRSAL